MTIYFVGCDIGGWHTDSKSKSRDAFAACTFAEGRLTHLAAQCGRLYYPVDSQGIFAKTLQRVSAEKARLVIAIDAALAWPLEFVKLVNAAPGANHCPEFDPSTGAIQNPCLYRETERFLRVRGLNKDPLTAPGSWFGNNASKAQALVAWIKRSLPGVYRPPFDRWDRDEATDAQHSVIEVYPAASMKNRLFRRLQWPRAGEQMTKVGDSDIGDAKRCAMTAVCYAATIRMEGDLSTEQYPPVLLPDNMPGSDVIAKEGWIFTPAPEYRGQQG